MTGRGSCCSPDRCTGQRTTWSGGLRSEVQGYGRLTSLEDSYGIPPDSTQPDVPQYLGSRTLCVLRGLSRSTPDLSVATEFVSIARVLCLSTVSDTRIEVAEGQRTAVPRDQTIFISYRRDASAGWAGRLQADLRSRLEFSTQVFTDIDGIPAGEDFARAIDNAVGRCDALVVVVGLDWITPHQRATD